MNECPNCWVVCDTTQKTLKIYKGMEAQPVPEEIQARLMDAIRTRKWRKCAGAQGKSGQEPI